MSNLAIDRTKIKELPENVRKNGFDYRLVQRNNKCCIYSQHNGIGNIIGYEIFKHKIVKYRERMNRYAEKSNKPIDLTLPEFAEAFPSDEEFGKRAWNYKKLESVLLAMKEKDLAC